MKQLQVPLHAQNQRRAVPHLQIGRRQLRNLGLSFGISETKQSNLNQG